MSDEKFQNGSSSSSTEANKKEICFEKVDHVQKLLNSFKLMPKMEDNCESLSQGLATVKKGWNDLKASGASKDELVMAFALNMPESELGTDEVIEDLSQLREDLFPSLKFSENDNDQNPETLDQTKPGLSSTAQQSPNGSKND